MKKRFIGSFTILSALAALSGCSAIGDKSSSMSMIYMITTVLSVLLLICYCTFTRKRESWFLFLFSSVLVVNVGYLTLAVSTSLEEALLANRIAYLGSVFLPMAMLMILLTVVRLKYPRWLPILLFGIGILVFFVAASPGYLDIYYKEVSLQVVSGVTMLNKVYGPWHCLYLYYLFSYFFGMAVLVCYITIRKKVTSAKYAVLLAGAVFINIVVWLLEQLVRIDFEILSISYIITGMFLLGLQLLMEEQEKQLLSLETAAPEDPPALPEDGTVSDEAALSESEPSETAESELSEEEIAEEDDPVNTQIEQYLAGLEDLTQTERTIYNFYISGKSTKEILLLLGIKENTLKFHNKNIYRKLGVSSRKQLTEVYRQLQAAETPCEEPDEPEEEFTED